MRLTSVKLVYFSPTGSSRKIAESVAKGIGMGVEHLDLTLPSSEGMKITLQEHELAVIAVPVYGGRVPATAARRIMNLSGGGGPAVLLVVYGNRAYEDALLELKDIAEGCGLKALAAAAFIGEHSYSTERTPIAGGRPDGADLEKAEAFGAEVFRRLGAVEEAPDLAVPGNRPYKERRASDPISPETNVHTCTLCGACARVCPAGAVTVKGSVETVKEECIRCTSCVKACPTGARTWAHPSIDKAAQWLYANFKDRKEPETFL